MVINERDFKENCCYGDWHLGFIYSVNFWCHAICRSRLCDLYVVEIMIKLKNGCKVYADATLESMTKKQLIGIIRMLEHNNKVLEERNSNQFNLLIQKGNVK